MKRVFTGGLTGILTSFFISIAVLAITGSVDFTTFTEIDSEGEISYTTTTATGTQVAADHQNYLYRNYGSGNFTAATINHTFSITSNTLQSSAYGTWGLSTAAGTFDDNASTGNHSVTFLVSNPSSPNQMRFGFYTSNETSTKGMTDYYVASKGVTYYIQVTVDTTTNPDNMVAKIYTDEARTTLVDTLNEPTYDNDLTYSHLYALQAMEGAWSSYTAHFNLSLADMDLLDQGGSAPKYWDCATSTWQDATLNAATGLYEYTDCSENVYVWVNDAWLNVGDSASGQAIWTLQDTAEESLEDIMQLAGLNNVGGKYMTLLILMGIAVAAGVYYRSKLLTVGGPILLFGAGLAWGWIQVWLLILLAVVASLVVAGIKLKSKPSVVE